MHNKKKIALVGFRLNTGGSERVMANLSNFFHDKGIDVHIIIFHDDLGYSYSGTVFNLGKLKSNANTVLNKIKRFYCFNNYIKKHQFDYIIDFRFRINVLQEYLINKCIYNTKTIYTIHSSEIQYYLPNNSFLTKLIYSNCFKIVAITDKMKSLINDRYQLNNVARIYNPANFKQISETRNEEVTLSVEFVISAGHFDTNQKQFDKLIDSYSKSILQSKGIALVIIGDGLKRNELINKAKTLGISPFVHFLGFKDNPFKYFSKAKCFLMTSLHEGMPMVLIESLACGTPVISFDCPTGPSEIIQNNVNGILVENQNLEKFTEALNTMILNEELYATCKKNAKESISKFSLESIGMEWMELMKYN